MCPPPTTTEQLTSGISTLTTLYTYARRRVGASVAPNVVADVFAVVVAHPERVPDDALLWLYRTA